MSVQASVTLAVLLTSILRARQSALFSGMTLAMLAMLWRGEAWKWAGLDLEVRVSQLPPQCLQLLPKTGCLNPASLILYAARRFASPPGAVRFRSVIAQLGQSRAVSLQRHTSRATHAALPSDSDSTLVASQLKGQLAYPAPCRASFFHIALDQRSQGNILADSELNSQPIGNRTQHLSILYDIYFFCTHWRSCNAPE